MHDIKGVLTKLGLTETESRVYLAMLKLGADTVQHIAREARISRTAAYEIISGLQKKSLASTFTQGKRKLFVAEDPEKLEGYFESRIKDITLELSALRRVLPELRLLQGNQDKPRVRFYTGEEGVRALFRDMAMVQPKELYEVSNVDAVYAAIDAKLLTAEQGKIDYSKMKTRVLYKGTLRRKETHAHLKQMTDKFPFEGDIWIYGNRVAFVHFYRKIEVVIIDNQIFADTMRAVFMTAWDACK